MSYYNTTNEQGEPLKTFKQKALTQDQKLAVEIIELNKPFSASQLWKCYGSYKCPLTSVRRSINTHLKDGFIVETGQKIKGMYGRPETQYKRVK